VRAEPMRQQVEETVIQAEAAMALKDWAHALDLYQRAGALIEEINQLFARSRYADIGLRNRLKSEENSLQGAAELAEIEVLVVGGDAVAFERSELAAEYYQRAITLQQSLNEQWSQSRFFSTTRLEQLTEKLQTVLSRDLIATMKREDEALTGLLAGRQLLVARAKITALELLGLQLVQELPKSRLSDEGLGRKCRYLSAVEDSIRELQDDVYDQLIPLPKDKAVMLMKGEVTQGLYARVMKFNPSRNLGDALSVDSLSWYETQEFCLRLSWILGLQVRLPLRDEVLNALGDGRKSFVEKSVVTSTDAVLVGQSRELYSDLEGNLAEWLWAESGTDDAWVLAGQVDPKLGAAGTAPFVLLLKKTRSREIGFRVFVQFSEP
jgi:tetratricopeptide (TPR) repeat protein